MTGITVNMKYTYTDLKQENMPYSTTKYLYRKANAHLSLNLVVTDTHCYDLYIQMVCIVLDKGNIWNAIT